MKKFMTPSVIPELDDKSCAAAPIMQQGNMFGAMALKTQNKFNELEQHRIIYESLVKLTLHEVGHT